MTYCTRVRPNDNLHGDQQRKIRRDPVYGSAAIKRTAQARNKIKHNEHAGTGAN